MIDSQKLEHVRRLCCFTDGLCLGNDGNSGDMGLWRYGINVVVETYSRHHISVNVIDEWGNIAWKALSIYGWSGFSDKHLTWQLMKDLGSNCTAPIIMFEDFNEIVSTSEKEGGAMRSEKHMDGFREVIDKCQLRDMGFKGNIFTWQRGNSLRTWVRERLDWFLASEGWCELIPNTEVIHFPIYRSDHAQILLEADRNAPSRQQAKHFHFEALWLSRDDCAQVVSEAWHTDESAGVPVNLAVCAEKLTLDTKKKLKQPSKDGIFSVKSCYWLGKLGHIRAWKSQPGLVDEETWKLIWNIDGPPNSITSCGGCVMAVLRLWSGFIIVTSLVTLDVSYVATMLNRYLIQYWSVHLPKKFGDIVDTRIC
ncbi:Histone-lysine N-methyltransferase H3 lysine-36 and H4 lysine-20 specific [Bienertia sinuspersici]